MKTFVIIISTTDISTEMDQMERVEALAGNAAVKVMMEAAEGLKRGGVKADIAQLEEDEAEAVVSGWHLQKIEKDDCKREDDHKKQSCRYNLDQEPVTHMV